MTKGLSLEEGTTVYIPAVRVKSKGDSESSVLLQFCCDSNYVFNEDFLTEEELKAKFNEGSSEKLPKQGEMIEVLHSDGIYSTTLHEFVSFYKGSVVVVSSQWGITRYDGWRFPRKKVQLTLAEVEEKLGIEKGSLIIKD